MSLRSSPKKSKGRDIDQVLDNNLSRLVAARPSMDASPTKQSSEYHRKSGGSSIPPVKPAAAAMPLYPVLPESDDDDEEFDFKKIASNHNFDDDKKIAAAPRKPNQGSFDNNNNNSFSKPIVPMAPGGDDDFMDKKMAAVAPAPPVKMTPEQKIQEKIRQENALRKSGTHVGAVDSNSFLTRPDRMEDRAINKKIEAKNMEANTGTRLPGAQSVKPLLPPSGASARVEAVQTAQPQEQVEMHKKEKEHETDNRMMVYGMAGVALVVVVVVIVVLVVTLGGNKDSGGDNSDASNSAPAAATEPPLTPFQENVLSLLPAGTQQAINTSKDGPQAKAFDWLTAGGPTPGYTDETLQQRFAMATFYYSSGGGAWANHELWVFPANECSWYSSLDEEGSFPCGLQVEPSNTEFVALKHLSLSKNGLSGTIPPQIGMLTTLETMDLSENKLQGPIPSELGLLTQLTEIELSQNALTGTIPSAMGNLVNLEQLGLESNALVGNVPASFSDVPLQYLYLKGNGMSGRIPEDACPTRTASIDCSKGVFCGCDCEC